MRVLITPRTKLIKKLKLIKTNFYFNSKHEAWIALPRIFHQIFD